MLCYIMLYYVMLCYVILRYVCYANYSNPFLAPAPVFGSLEVTSLLIYRVEFINASLVKEEFPQVRDLTSVQDVNASQSSSFFLSL